MRIESIRIENYRVFEDSSIPLNRYTCFVGPNGAGKSTIVNALNLFFHERASSAESVEVLEEEDFHKRTTAVPVRITLTFTDLSVEAQEDFKHYFRQGKLVVTAEARWDESTGHANVKQFGQRLGMSAFRPYFAGVDDRNVKVPDLKKIYEEIRERHPDLPRPGSKEQMTDALLAFESEHPDACVLIPSEDQFYGVSKGTNRLEKYVQWVFVPAVKDASSEQLEARNTALGKLLARTVRARTNFGDDVKKLREETLQHYEEILAKNQGALSELSGSLAQRLMEWAHPDVTLELQWQKDQKSVSIGEPFAGIIAGEGGFAGSLSKFGHGLQRSYLITLLQELAGCAVEGSPSLILACEEPELYQHPPQIRHLSSVLQRLAEKDNQVLVCTHSPWFVSGEGFENVRMVRKRRSAGCATVSHKSFREISEVISLAQGDIYTRDASGTLAKINQELQPEINEIFFTPVLILVEGIEDVAYITTCLYLMDKWDEFRKSGCHIVPAGGKSHMVMPLAIACELQIPVFVLFDSDSHSLEKKEWKQQHEKTNRTILCLAGAPPEPFPDTTLWQHNLVMWFTEIGHVVDQEFDPEILEQIKNEVNLHFGNVGELQKNVLFIARKLSRAWEQGHRSPSLVKLCNSILAFARASESAGTGPRQKNEGAANTVEE